MAAKGSGHPGKASFFFLRDRKRCWHCIPQQVNYCSNLISALFSLLLNYGEPDTRHLPLQERIKPFDHLNL
jgi:hypothetical protein